MRVVRSPHAHATLHARRSRRRCARAGPASSTCSPPPTCRTTPSRSFADLRDQPVLADGIVRFRGEAVLALVGDADAVLGDRRRRAADPLHAAAGARASADALAAAGARHAGAGALPRQRALPRPRRARRRRGGARRRGARRRARRSRRATSSTPTSSPRPAGPRSSKARRDGAPLARVRIFACTQTPYMDRDEIANVLAPLARAGAHRAVGDRRRLRRQARPLGPAAARGRRLEARPRRCASSTSGPSRCSRAPSAIPRQMQASAACDARRPARRPSTSPATSTPAPTRRGGRRSPTGCRSTPAARTASPTCAR